MGKGTTSPHLSKVGKLLAFIGIWMLASSAASRAPNPSDEAQPKIDLTIFKRVAHVGWVVGNLDRVLDHWERLGIKDIHRHGLVQAPEVTYRGRKVVATLRTATASIGGTEIDWIQPVSSANAYSDFLKQHGDGIHHLAFRVSTSKQFDEQIQRFKRQGVGAEESGSWPGKNGIGRFVYLDTASHGGGITFELIYDSDQAASAPAATHDDYPFEQIVQYAFVVRDLRAVNDFYEGLGFGGMGVERFVGLERRYHGAPSNYEMDLGWWRWGDVPFEWIQSQVGPNVYEDYRKVHGEGLHHLGFNVKDLDQAVALFHSKGVAEAQSGAWDIRGSRGRYAYVDTEPFGGVTIELLWNEPHK